jgi:hypothetical protein
MSALFPSNMQPHSFSKRQLAAIALILDEGEKNVALSDKKKRMWVHRCFRSRKSEGEYWTVNKELADDEMKFYQYFRMSKHQFSYLLQQIEKDEYYLPRRNSDGGIFADSKLGKYLETHLGIPDGKQLPGTSCLAPHVIADDDACPLKTNLMRPYPGSTSKGDSEKSIFNYRLSRARRVVENAFGILSQKFQIYQRTLQSLPENADIIYATCILHNYLKEQGVGLSDMGSSGNVQSNLTKIPKKCPRKSF